MSASGLLPDSLAAAAGCEIAIKWRITYVELFTRSQARKYAWPRQEFMSFLYHQRCWNTIRIAQFVGRTPSAVSYGIDAHDGRVRILKKSPHVFISLARPEVNHHIIT